jgi:hypothetical protein
MKWVKLALEKPDYKEIQADGRIRYWVYVPDLGKYLRVVTLSDGKTVHNAFPDRNFKQSLPFSDEKLKEVKL